MKPLSMWRNKKQIKYAPIFRVTRLEGIFGDRVMPSSLAEFTLALFGCALMVAVVVSFIALAYVVYGLGLFVRWVVT